MKKGDLKLNGRRGRALCLASLAQATELLCARTLRFQVQSCFRWQPGASAAVVPVCAVSRDTGRAEHGLASAQGMDCRRQVFPGIQMTH